MPIEILGYHPTTLGILCLRRRELLSRPGTTVTEVTLNHQFLMSSYLTESERALARIGLQRLEPGSKRQPGPLKVLVGGLGLGYTAAEALRSDRVADLEVVELLPEVAGWLREGLIPLASQLNADGRLAVTEGDIYGRLAQPPSTRVDLILIDVDHSPQDVLGQHSSGFYTEAGLQTASQHLTPGGTLGIWSYAEDSPLLAKMKRVFHDVQTEQVSVWNDLIHQRQTDWLFFGSTNGDRPRC